MNLFRTFTVSEQSTIEVATLPSATNRERVNGLRRRHLAAGGRPNRLGVRVSTAIRTIGPLHRQFRRSIASWKCSSGFRPVCF